MNDNVTEIVAAELKNHQLVIEDIAFNSGICIVHDSS